MIRNISTLFALALAAVACTGQRNYSKELVGTWTEPIPGQEGRQGIELKSDGTAKSVNMATLDYKTWKVEDEQLILTGTSIGNNQTIDFADTLKIVELSKGSLVVAKGEWQIRYSR